MSRQVFAYFTTAQHHNPLDGLRLQFVDKYATALVHPLPLNVQAHLHQLISIIIMYHSIYVISSWIAPMLFPQTFARLSRKNQIDYHIHVVSMIQSLLILTLCIPCFMADEETQQRILSSNSEERVFGQSGYLAFLATLALGYFVWDALISLVYVSYFGVGFLIHGIMSAMVFFIGLSPFIQYYAPIFILFEISTPFLNIRWFALKIPGSIPPSLQLINNAVLILIFFLVRICYGWFQAFTLFSDFAELWIDPRFSQWRAIVIISGNLVLNALNLYWFWRMTVVAYATLADMLTGSKSREEAKNDI